MPFLTRLILVVVLVVLVGGVGFLATWDMPPPSATVEKQITLDRIQK